MKIGCGCIILYVFVQISALSFDDILTAGSCDAASLVGLLLAAIASAVLVVRLPGGTLLTFLPGVLLPAWLLCGTLATADGAVVASLLAAWLRTRDLTRTFLTGGVTLLAVAVGAASGALVSAALVSAADFPLRQAALGGAFLGGYTLAEAGALRLARDSALAPLISALPRSHILASLILLLPGLVIANTLMARGSGLFLLMLLVLTLALGLIALYISATTSREAIVQERARFVRTAAGGIDVPADVLEERAMELTHELRSPLTAILGYAGLLARAGIRDRAREETYVASITASSNYMLRLVNNILDLQRLESGTQPLQLRHVTLDQFLSEALASIQPRADEKGVRTLLAVAPGLPSLITDELLLRRAIDNLLSNAVKYTRPGDEIRLTASREGPTIAIAVADSGIGLTEEERERVFERFFRGRRSEARAERGTGLGLTIVRESVHRLNGQVRVESTLGRGSTFTLLLPLGDE